MWPKLGTLAFSSYQNLNFIRISPEKPIYLSGPLGSSSIIWDWHLKVWAWNFASVDKRVKKLKVRKFWKLILTFVEVTGEKLAGVSGVFLNPSLSLRKIFCSGLMSFCKKIQKYLTRVVLLLYKIFWKLQKFEWNYLKFWPIAWKIPWNLPF